MRKLEEAYGDRIAVVGIHSGKYTAERITPNIRDAALRLDAAHPTLNDRQFRVWRSYAVQAWPTLVAVNPNGYVVGVHAGEFSADDLRPFIDRVLGEFSREELNEAPLQSFPDAPTHSPGSLRFPGKVAVADGRIAISDSGNRRVIVARLDGTTARLERTIDGFVNPQGLAFSGDLLYVTDPGAHQISEIALHTGAARIVAGIGRQARSQADLGAGALSSPWDIVVRGPSLLVAMAGMHQLWKIDIATGAGGPFSGSGAEEIHDAPHATAALAQPMGLVLHDQSLLFCDSESNAIRVADLELTGGVRTIVGTGLFEFGDVDGTGDEVRLQHPQSLARLNDGRILIADSYNGALKWVDTDMRSVTTWARSLDEPSGLAVSNEYVFVAEPNAHRISALEIASGAARVLTLVP